MVLIRYARLGYDANDRLLTEVLDVAGGLRGGDTTTTYTYDGTQLVGKTVAATVGGKLHAVTTHTYNVMGRLASTTETRYDPAAKQSVVLGTTVTDYTYDRNGLRVTETTTTDHGSGGTPVVKSFLFDPRNPTGFAQVLEEYVDGVIGWAPRGVIQCKRIGVEFCRLFRCEVFHAKVFLGSIHGRVLCYGGGLCVIGAGGPAGRARGDAGRL